MALKRTSVNISDVTQRQLRELHDLAGFGGISDIVRRAVDRMWYDEIGRQAERRQQRQEAEKPQP